MPPSLSSVSRSLRAVISGRHPRAAVLKYYLYQATDSVGFIWPIFTLFLLWNELTYTQIGTLSAISAVLVVTFEIPTGYLADRIGRRNALAIGMATMGVSIAGFVVARSFRQFVALYVFWALAMALHHGTDDAWLYATLQETADEESFTRIKGRGGAIYQLGSAVTMILGGFLYVAHPTYPFVGSAILNAAGVAVVLSMPQNPQPETKSRLTRGARESLSLLREEFIRSGFRAFVLYAALFFGVIAAADTYIQPITVAVLEDLSVGGVSSLSALGFAVPPEAILGFVYAGFALVAAVASYNAETIRKFVGLRTTLLVVPVGIAVLFVFLFVIPVFAIPVFFAMKGADSLTKPLVAQYLNDRISEAGRATVLSAASMSYAAIRAPLKPVSGVFADLTTPFAAVGALGAFFLLVSIALFVFTTPIERRNRECSIRSHAGLED